MISPLDGWTWDWLDDDGVMLAPRDLADAGAIVYHERLRPVRPALELVEAQLAATPGLEVLEIERAEELQTLEGEQAVMVTARARNEGVEMQLDFGLVCADDYYARIGGTCVRPAAFARFSEAVRRLVLTDEHMLGVRRRPCRFRAPEGWTARQRGFERVLFAPDGDACMNVLPALPAGGVGGYLESLLQHGGLPVERGESRPCSTEAGLHGTIHDMRLHGGEATIHRQVAVLDDGGSYAFCVRLDALSDEALRAQEWPFLQVLRSIERFPSVRRLASLSQADAMSHWT